MRGSVAHGVWRSDGNQRGAPFARFQAIIDRHILDKARVEERFGSGLHTYTEAAHVQRHVAEALTAAMTEAGAAGTMQRRGARVLELGSGTGSLSRRLDAIAGTDTYIETWDLAGEACLAGPRRHFRRTDAETGLWNLPSESFDVIASASTVQWFNSLPAFLPRAAACAPGGYVAFSAFVRGNLREVSAATHRTLRVSIDEWLALVPEDDRFGGTPMGRICRFRERHRRLPPFKTDGRQRPWVATAKASRISSRPYGACSRISTVCTASHTAFSS